MIKQVIFIAILTSVYAPILSARVLAVFPLPSRSHQNVHEAIILETVNRGHEVTMITPYPLKSPPKNLTQIDISFVINRVKESFDFNEFVDKDALQFHFAYQALFPSLLEDVLNMDVVKNIMEGDPDQFDLLFLPFTSTAFGFAHKFKNASAIVIATLPMLYPNFGAPTHPLFYNEFYSNLDTDLNILTRMKSLVDHSSFVYKTFNVFPKYQNNLLKYFGNDTPAVFENLSSELDLLFVYSNPLLSNPRPEGPAIIHIEGIHLKHRNPLAKDIQDFLDKSTQGVIYMSLGSNVQSKNLDAKTLEAITSAFAELPYNVLWKFEADNLPGLPSNVLIKKWMPQQDLLGHKNIKAFIFQGGLQSLEEAIRDAVPLICIPFAADQKANAQKVEKKGLGVRLDIFSLTKEKLKDAIMIVTSEPRFKQNMEKLAKLFADQHQTPMERAMWWIEYVLRHKGAEHLRSPAIDDTYAEYFMLDDIGFLLLVAGVTVAVTFVLFRLTIKFLSVLA